MDLDTLITIIEETVSSSKPLIYAVFTLTGELNLERLEGGGSWVITLIEEGCDPLELEGTANVVFLLEWKEASIGVSSGTPGFIPIYQLPVGFSENPDLWAFPSSDPLRSHLNYLYSDSTTHATGTAGTGIAETLAKVDLASVSIIEDQVNTMKIFAANAKRFLYIQPSQSMTASTKQDFPYNTAKLLEVLEAYKRSLGPTDTKSTAVGSDIIFLLILDSSPTAIFNLATAH